MSMPAIASFRFPRKDVSVITPFLSERETAMHSSELKSPPRSCELTPLASTRCGLSVADLRQSFLDNLFCGLGRVPLAATRNDACMALALTVRDRVLMQGVRSLETYAEQDARVVAYLSAEFLPGPHLANNLLNLGIVEPTRQALSELGLNLDELLDQEEDPGLGNGGLGRLASCYLDSLASLEVAAVGYGIRYEFGIFDQKIKDGWQVEGTDKWLSGGNPWEIARPEIAYDVKFGGHTETGTDEHGHHRVRWVPRTVVKGMAYDTPILGYRVGTCNHLRLWKAEAVESFDFSAFNHGDYYRAVEDKMHSENITKVLYPNDEVIQGKTLRLQQQFLFVTCSLQDMIRVHRLLERPLVSFHEKWAVQLNDTHPAIAVAELMRLLVDKHRMDWDTAWDVTRRTFAYTNHTLLPEALEKWPVGLLGYLLPRHLELIYEINRRFLDEVRARFPGDEARLARLQGTSAIGHVRYSTAGGSLLENAQPIVYNTNKVTPAEAKILASSWKGVLDPRFKGRFAIVKRKCGACYGAVHMFLDPKLAGEYGEKFLKDVAAQKPLVYSDNPIALDRIVAGERDFVFWLWESIAYTKWQQGAPIRWVRPSPTPEWGNSWNAVSKHAPHPHAARLMQNWLFSEEGTIALQDTYGAATVLKGVKDTRKVMTEPWYQPIKKRYDIDWDRWKRNYEADMTLWQRIQDTSR